ncbi:hypothetical protein TIFTF001_030173 [Ficus carica]|uniref:Uncharacterized protein n=1 Tax=Ficus carica TaxID=3494 RepID=A0AA88DSN2_FICCA|nr:hypothetical protein TIFTF001_030173 [Ficus carica]
MTGARAKLANDDGACHGIAGSPIYLTPLLPQRRLSLCIDSARYSSTAMIRPDLARANLVGDDLSHSVRDPPEFAHRRSSQRIQQIGHRSDQSSMRLCWRSSKSEFMGVSLLTFVCVSKDYTLLEYFGDRGWQSELETSGHPC